MPIYEFRCLKCGKIFEKLFIIGSREKADITCPECGAESFERVMSSTNYAMGEGKGSKSPKITTKSCGSGNKCSTLELPGYGD